MILVQHLKQILQASQKATSNPTPLKLVFVIDFERGHGDIMGHAGHLRQGHEYRGVWDHADEEQGQ